MPREFSRSVRVAATIRRGIGPLVSAWVREQGGGIASVVATEVSPDLKRARVSVSLYGVADPDALMAALNDHAPRLRYTLGKQLRLRNQPMLEFKLDESIADDDSISRTLAGLGGDVRER